MFLFILYFITFESVIIFGFIKDIYDKLFFYNCLCSKIIYGDFAKELTKSIAISKIKKQKSRLNKQYILQLYKCHGVKAIKQHFLVISKYFKKQHDKIIDLI